MPIYLNRWIYHTIFYLFIIVSYAKQRNWKPIHIGYTDATLFTIEKSKLVQTTGQFITTYKLLYRLHQLRLVSNQVISQVKHTGLLKLNKIAARWPAKAVAQFFYFF